MGLCEEKQGIMPTLTKDGIHYHKTQLDVNYSGDKTHFNQGRYSLSQDTSGCQLFRG